MKGGGEITCKENTHISLFITYKSLQQIVLLSNWNVLKFSLLYSFELQVSQVHLFGAFYTQALMILYRYWMLC